MAGKGEQLPSSRRIVPKEIVGFREYFVEIVSDIGRDVLFPAHK